MVDDKQRPGESESDIAAGAPETGSGEGEGPATVNEAAGLEEAPSAGEAAAPGELLIAEAGHGPDRAEPEKQSAAAEQDAEAQPALPPPPPPLALQVRRRTPWGALLLSGIIGGLVVAGAAAYGYFKYLPSNNSAINVLFARLGAVELTVRDLSAHQAAAPPASSESAQAAGAPDNAGTTKDAGGETKEAGATQEAVTQLADRLTKLEAAVAAAAEARAKAADTAKPEGLISPPPEQAAEMKALSDEVVGLNKRIAENAAALQLARDTAAAAIKAAEEKPSQPPGVGKVEFEGLGERVTGLQQSMATLQQDVQRQAAETTQEDRGVRLAVVAAGLRGAVERGAPYASELEAAKALQADPQAVALLAPFATTGVPSAAALGQEVAALAPSLAKRAATEPDQSYWQRLQSEAEKLVSVRPINSAPGNSTAAVAARIEGLGKRGDIAGALAELQKLPEAVRAPAEPWIKKAQAREAAIAAAQRIEAAAIAAIAKHP